MGISTHYYTVYGVFCPKTTDDMWEMGEKAYELWGSGEVFPVTVIQDGMGGTYTIIGKILFDSGDLRWGDTEDTFAEIHISSLYDYREKAIAAFKEKMDSKWWPLLDGEWKLMTFAHYS
jgi:hypothetical protein